jgi:polynucleotide 5'-hydroxyl-kinase GRC3/NOL9
MKGQPKGYKRLEITPEPEWERLVEGLVNRKGTALLLGATNSGKSTLARYLIERFISKNIDVSLIDSDIGQSSLGLPGTINMKIFKKAEDIKDFSTEKIFFVGSLNPAKKIPLMIDGLKKMVSDARNADIINVPRTESKLILVDTTGLIHGEAGKALKLGKIKAIRPEHLIVIQRHDELEHLIAPIKDIDIHGALSQKCSIHRIKASKMVMERDREARIRYRREKFNDYFDEEKVTEFFLEDIALFYNGKLLGLRGIDFKEGTLIGLNHNKDTMALGILLELDGNSITFKSPIKSVEGVNGVTLGDINVYE